MKRFTHLLLGIAYAMELLAVPVFIIALGIVLTIIKMFFIQP